MGKTFTEFYFDYIKNPNSRFVGRLLALDPGETTGWSLWLCSTDSINLLRSGQLTCNPIEMGIKELTALVDSSGANHIVYEDYKVYSWKSAAHSWASLHTPQLIGVIHTIAAMRGIPTSKEMAQQAKAFCTDDKLSMWGYYIKGQRHCRDSIRHALFWLLFRYKPAAK